MTTSSIKRGLKFTNYEITLPATANAQTNKALPTGYDTARTFVLSSKIGTESMATITGVNIVLLNGNMYLNTHSSFNANDYGGKTIKMVLCEA